MKTILIMCYTGFRPGELLSVKKENVFIDERIIIGGFKTDAGTNRHVPIHNKILPFVEEFYNKNDRFLIQNEPGRAGSPIDLNNWRKRNFIPTLVELGILENEKDNHVTPKSGRKTFASLADEAKLPPNVIERIIGHTDFDTTNEFYIQKSDRELTKNIDLIL